MKQLSLKAGLSESAVRDVLSRGREPGVDNFLKMAEAAGVSPSWLLQGDEGSRLNEPAELAEVAGGSAGWRKRLVLLIDETPGLTMKALSKEAGLNDGYVSAMLKKGIDPTVTAFLALAEAAGVSPAWLLHGDDQTTLASSNRLQALERRLQNVEMPLARQIAEVEAKIDNLAAQVAKLLQRVPPKP